ncbi:MAG: hypothetical protein C0392_13155 [Syntrophus sp. (in: bacteria)]|nr:hypothetical protein [Syntrophus sp. (in: bacteria)]
MLRIIVDIDNTLWSFAPVLYEYLSDAGFSIPSIKEWNEWQFWDNDMNKKTFYGILKQIHMRQEEFDPYEDAIFFLNSLKDRGFYILIASHREQETYDPTLQWLQKYKLPFDELHVLNDKSILFDGAFGIVDDSPITLDKARRAGIVATGLLCPWNKNMGLPLFDGLPEVLSYIDGELAKIHSFVEV